MRSSTHNSPKRRPIWPLALILPIFLAACGGPAEPVWAPDDEVAARVYAHPGPAEITLYTVINKRTGSGAHAGLLISGQSRILFDPAGTFAVSFVPERNDVLHGMTPRALAAYIDYHARESHDVIEQRLSVTPEQAALIAARVQSYGPVPKAQCTLSITRILREVPGFQTLPVSYFPNSAHAWFATRPGVQTGIITDDTVDRSHNVTFAAR